MQNSDFWGVKYWTTHHSFPVVVGKWNGTSRSDHICTKCEDWCHCSFECEDIYFCSKSMLKPNTMTFSDSVSANDITAGKFFYIN